LTPDVMKSDNTKTVSFLKSGYYMLKIRRYQPQDNEAVKQLHYSGIAQMVELIPEANRITPPAGDEPFDSDLDDIEGVYIENRGDFLVGTENGEIVVIGALRHYTDDCGELKRLRVRRDRQRRGLGQAMMAGLVSRAKELGYKELILDTLPDNLPAQRLFEKCGFTRLRLENRGLFHLVIYGQKINQEGR
jgi:GNAT superfamily N-acetyltransferase